jgi:hypothetical protein
VTENLTSVNGTVTMPALRKLVSSASLICTTPRTLLVSLKPESIWAGAMTDPTRMNTTGMLSVFGRSRVGSDE